MGVFIWSVGVTVWQQFLPHHHTDIYKMMNESSYEDHHTSERKKKKQSLPAELKYGAVVKTKGCTE